MLTEKVTCSIFELITSRYFALAFALAKVLPLAFPLAKVLALALTLTLTLVLTLALAKVLAFALTLALAKVLAFAPVRRIYHNLTSFQTFRTLTTIANRVIERIATDPTT
jgi:hypothetical protein